jgi:hypothetical protein
LDGVADLAGMDRRGGAESGGSKEDILKPPAEIMLLINYSRSERYHLEHPHCNAIYQVVFERLFNSNSEIPAICRLLCAPAT